MIMIFKCLKVQDGVIALADLTGYDLSGITAEDSTIYLTEQGLLMKIKDIEIPIPESMIGYILDNRNISIYSIGADRYFEEPSLSIKISRETMIEAKGAYNFWKKTRHEVINI